MSAPIPPPPPPIDEAPPQKPTYARYCVNCPDATVRLCQQTFGNFWLFKSSFATGCDNPLSFIEESPT